MGLFKSKNENCKMTVKMLHESGLPTVGKILINLTLDELNKCVAIDINPKYSKGATNFTLPFDKITSVERITEETLKQKSGLGRAVVGGALFGPAGAVVGAVTKKDKKQTTFYRVIKYSSNNEAKEIVMKSADANEIKFFEKLNSIIIPEVKSGTSIEL